MAELLADARARGIGRVAGGRAQGVAQILDHINVPAEIDPLAGDLAAGFGIPFRDGKPLGGESQRFQREPGDGAHLVIRLVGGVDVVVDGLPFRELSPRGAGTGPGPC